MKKHVYAFGIVAALMTGAASGQTHFENRMVQIKAEVAALPPETTGTIVMLGDSITEGFFRSESMPKKVRGLRTVNHGIGGDVIGTTTSAVGVTARLDEVTKSKPTIIFLMIGVNNLWNRDVNPDEVYDYYEAMFPRLKAAAPDAKIVVQSILPTRDDKAYTNKNAAILNWRIQRLAAANGAQWLDVAALLSDDRNELKAEFTNDAVHLTPEAYKIWLAEIDKTVEEIQNN